MKRPISLIAAQDAHIERILAATPYHNNNDMGNLTLLRRKMSTIRSSRAQYRRDLETMGYTDDQISITMRDAEDIAVLEHNAEQ